MMSSHVWNQCCRTAGAVRQQLSNRLCISDSNAPTAGPHGGKAHVLQQRGPFVSWAIYVVFKFTSAGNSALTQIELQVDSEL